MTSRPNWVAKTEDAIDEHTAPAEGERKYARGADAETTDQGVLRHEQQEEIAQSWFGLGFMTDGQLKGGATGTAIGAVVGALLFLPLALVEWGDLALGWRLGIAAVCGALAGSTAMAVYLGGRRPELEGETQDVVGGPSIGTTLRDSHTDERGR